MIGATKMDMAGYLSHCLHNDGDVVLFELEGNLYQVDAFCTQKHFQLEQVHEKVCKCCVEVFYTRNYDATLCGDCYLGQDPF